MGECDLEVIGAPSIFSVIRSAAALARMLPILDLSCEENAAVLRAEDQKKEKKSASTLKA